MSEWLKTLPLIWIVSGCSAWIDDFSIGDASVDGGYSQNNDSISAPVDTDVDSDTDSDVDTDTDTDTDSDVEPDTDPVECGHSVTPPNGNDIEFCSLKGGTYFMGCDEAFETPDSCLENERPVHEVELSSFLLQRFEVTEESYAAFVDDQPAWAPDSELALTKCGANYLSDWHEGAPIQGRELRPVLWVCWYAAQAFCHWLGDDFDLPTEAEWEFAARGVNDGHDNNPYWTFPFGNEPTCTLANYEGCGAGVLDVGAAKGATWNGIFDMGGNAWEWVNDWYRDDYYCDPSGTGQATWPNCVSGNVQKNPEGDAEGTVKVVRGGSWYHSTDMMRSARRHGLDPKTSSNLSGFRCAR